MREYQLMDPALLKRHSFVERKCRLCKRDWCDESMWTEAIRFTKKSKENEKPVSEVRISTLRAIGHYITTHIPMYQCINTKLGIQSSTLNVLCTLDRRIVTTFIDRQRLSGLFRANVILFFHVKLNTNTPTYRFAEM